MNRLLPIAVLVTLAGYFGPWVDHRAAGLVITGLDLGEVVKFLPPVTAGTLWLWRPGFYAPLVVAAAAGSLTAYRRPFAYPLWLRLGLLLLAAVAAANLLPPAWTPSRLLTGEFRVQMIALVVLLGGLALSPALAHLPEWLWRGLVLVLVVPAVGFPAQGFLAVLPALAELYGHALRPGWGFWLMLVGLALLALAVWTAPGAVRSSVHSTQGGRHADRRDE